MTRNGQARAFQRPVPGLSTLPRPVYGRTESLRDRALTQRHAHPWVQLSYAIAGVLEVVTDEGRFVAPPQRAIWIPGGMNHQVYSSPRTEMRSLYLDASVSAWAPPGCRVLGVSPLLRELIRAFAALPVEYPEDGAEGRLVAVLLDQLRQAPGQQLVLPLPRDTRLRQLCRALQQHPQRTHALGDWAARLGCSEKTLSRRFQQETGLGFRAWRQRQRLFAALAPLERGERVTDVALACGYDSTSAFIAAFARLFGTTPGEFFRADGLSPGAPDA